MNKMKAFFAAIALVLVTAGVFAGNSRFFDTYTVYAETGTGGSTVYKPFSSVLPSNMTTTQSGLATQVIFNNQASVQGGLYYYDVTTSTQKAIYPNF